MWANHLLLHNQTLHSLCNHFPKLPTPKLDLDHRKSPWTRSKLPTLTTSPKRAPTVSAAAVPPQPLDLTEDNVKLVLADARVKFEHLFDASIGMTGVVELAELDGPFVKISLRGRFWHKRSDVLARVGNYLKQRIPEILEVDIEDEKQLDDSPENF
ncbi:hypothetical protein UlMin_042802 [Ulmus minor]